MTDPEKEEQIARLARTSEEFRHLHEEHQHLSFHVEELSNRRNLSDLEREELRRLKKKKLLLKDAIGRLLFEDEVQKGRH